MAGLFSARVVKALVVILLVVFVLLIVAERHYQNLLDLPVIAAPDDLYQIKNGLGLNAILEDIHAQGLVTTPLWALKLHSRLSEDQGSMKAGEYRLAPNMSSRTLIKLFRSGKVYMHQVTFPEGLSLSQWLDLLRDNSVLEQHYSDAALSLMLAGKPPEGRFFPDTYNFVRGESDMDVLRRAKERMTNVSRQIWQAAGSGQDSPLRSIDELLVLASMIEKETGAEVDRKTIASVFHNRLKLRMKLQSDPTVIYGIKDFDGNITRKHLRQPTPYNTYVIRGLPPTPICNSGLASLQAAMYPESTPYIYFVAKGDGSSQFSVTLKEHNAAVTLYQKTARVRNRNK